MSRGLTVVGVVEVDDFLPAVVSHCVDDGAMIIWTHAYGEIQESGGRCQNLDTTQANMYIYTGCFWYALKRVKNFCLVYLQRAILQKISQ